MDFTLPETYLNGAVLYLDKPLKWTSFDVVNKVRRSLRQYLGIRKIKVGHTGTLDPLATGLIILCTGKATKQILHFQDMDKEYEAVIRTGATTPSFDLETSIDRHYPWEHITREEVGRALDRFTGKQEQVPPVFSAKSVDGKRAYDMARKGLEIVLKPHPIEIYSLELLQFVPPEIRLKISCSKGTYIRSLARDIGFCLGSGAHLSGLRRTRIGPHHVDQSISIEKFLENLKPL